MSNRIIKFRIWDGFEFHNFDEFVSLIEDKIESFQELTKHKSLKIQQFTGLLDKNNKEIYEGDLVNYYYIPGMPHGIEREDFQNEEVRYNPKSTAFVFGRWESHPYEIKDIEVVGNIFEKQ